MSDVGAGNDSFGSELIMAIVDKPDPRPIYIGIWGDCSVVAQAIWRVQNTRSPAELECTPYANVILKSGVVF